MNPVVQIFVGGRLCTGLLGTQKADGLWSVFAIHPEPVSVRTVIESGKGEAAVAVHSLVIQTCPTTLIPQAEVWPGGDPSHGTFFVEWGDENGLNELREWHRRKATGLTQPQSGELSGAESGESNE